MTVIQRLAVLKSFAMEGLNARVATTTAIDKVTSVSSHLVSLKFAPQSMLSCCLSLLHVIGHRV